MTKLARAPGVSRQSINELLRERRAVSPEMALRLARLFGNTPEFWLEAIRCRHDDSVHGIALFDRAAGRIAHLRSVPLASEARWLGELSGRYDFGLTL